MILRPLSRAIAVSVTTAAIVLASVVVAVADPNPAVGLRNVTSGTDVAAPDQQNPIVAPGNVTHGTDVAAPDQQSPIPERARHPLARPVPPPAPAHVSAPSSFHWDDAGIGAGGALALVLAGLGVTLVVRRRRISGPALPA